MYWNASVTNLWQLTFTVHGDPKSWKRAVPIGKGRVIGHARNTGYQTQVGWSAKAAMTMQQVTMTEFAVVLFVTFYFTPPLSWAKGARSVAIANQVPCVIRADTDNFVKNLNDGLNGIAFKDDHQVVDIHAERRWTDGRPRAEVTLRAWRPSNDFQSG